MSNNILANRYEVQKQLGKKAGRQTLLAKDLQTQELVIVKLLSFNHDFQWDDLKLFEREAETLKSLSHPHIPRYLDYFEINTDNFKGFALIQTYISAKTLEQYLETGRKFTESEVKQIAKSVLKILVYLHSLNPPVIHRDIKPSNILLTDRTGNSSGQVYLIDFGSVQTALGSEGIGTRTIVGTYGYMPQEQFGGRTVPASDLYSLGCTIIYLVTGSHPADLPEKDFRIQFTEVANLSPNFTHWLKLMTEPSLGNRLSSAQNAITALDKPQLPAKTNPQLLIKKPNDSKIELTKDKNFIDCMIPPSGLTFKTLNLIWNNCILIAITQICLQTMRLNEWTASPLFVILFLLLLGITSISVYMLLFTLFGKLKLHITQHKIELVRELWGTKIKLPTPAKKEDICLIQRIRKYERKQYIFFNSVAVEAQLIIWVGKNKKFTIGNNNELISELELDWLAQELSTWLNMPIKTESIL
ncbi:MAG: serine/threonine protein kinase [Cuspidothrix sp.]